MDRIVITGYGVAVPGARNEEQLFQLFEADNCHFKLSSTLSTPKQKHILVGEINDSFGTNRNIRKYARSNRLAIAVSKEAVQMAGLTNQLPNNTAVIFGTSVGNLSEVEEASYRARQENYRHYPMTSVANGNIGSLSIGVGAQLKIKGELLTLGNTCTAGSDAIMMGKRYLEHGFADTCIVGGAETPLNATMAYGFSKIRALSQETDVKSAGMPFSTSTNGFVMAEGGGALILERESSAKERGATILGVLDQVATLHDAKSIFASDETGLQMSQLWKGLATNKKISYIQSQALGLADNDNVEAIAYKNTFDGTVPITSIKGHVGHSFAASGVIQVIVALLSIKHRFIPNTFGTDKAGFEDLPVVAKFLREDISSVLVSSHGFGGSNTGLIINKA